jgi:DNA gyrase subunit B
LRVAYAAKDITVLKGLEPVRERPGMYIGSTGPSGLHHLVYEVVDNSVDEALAGRNDRIEVTLHPDHSVTVRDWGSGIPIGIVEGQGESALTVVLTKLHAGGKFGGDGYKVSGGLHGVGVSVVNALSEWCEVEVLKEGTLYTQRYERGKPTGPMTSRPAEKDRKGSGTVTRFKPDATVFEDTEFHYDTLTTRMRELAFLNSGLTIALIDERSGKSHSYNYKGGIVEFVKYLNQNKEVLHSKPVFFARERDRVSVEVSLQYNDSYAESVYSFVNNINTVEGGTHLIGFRSALTSTLTNYAEKEGMAAKAKIQLTGEDVREGLCAVISVKMPDPQFEGQTKTKLGNSEIKGLVQSIVGEGLRGIFGTFTGDTSPAGIDNFPPVFQAKILAGVCGIYIVTGGVEQIVQNKAKPAVGEAVRRPTLIDHQVEQPQRLRQPDHGGEKESEQRGRANHLPEHIDRQSRQSHASSRLALTCTVLCTPFRPFCDSP